MGDLRKLLCELLVSDGEELKLGDLTKMFWELNWDGEELNVGDLTERLELEWRKLWLGVGLPFKSESEELLRLLRPKRATGI